MHAGQALRVDCLESDSAQLRRFSQAAELGLGELLEAMPDGHRMIASRQNTFVAAVARLYVAARSFRADPLHAASRQHPLLRHVEQPVLEASAAQIGDENFHDAFLFE